MPKRLKHSIPLRGLLIMLSVMFVVLAAESWLNKFFFLQRTINAFCKILLVRVVELCFVLCAKLLTVCRYTCLVSRKLVSSYILQQA